MYNSSSRETRWIDRVMFLPWNTLYWTLPRGFGFVFLIKSIYSRAAKLLIFARELYLSATVLGPARREENYSVSYFFLWVSLTVCTYCSRLGVRSLKICEHKPGLISLYFVFYGAVYIQRHVFFILLVKSVSNHFSGLTCGRLASHHYY